MTERDFHKLFARVADVLRSLDRDQPEWGLRTLAEECEAAAKASEKDQGALEAQVKLLTDERQSALERRTYAERQARGEVR